MRPNYMVSFSIVSKHSKGENLYIVLYAHYRPPKGGFFLCGSEKLMHSCSVIIILGYF